MLVTAEKWMRDGSVMSLGSLLADDSRDDEYLGVALNWRHVRAVIVSSDDPKRKVPTFEMADVDIAAL